MNIALKSAVFCLGLFCANQATAQMTDGETPMFGVKLGLNGSYLSTNDDQVADRKGKIGVAAGVFIKMPLNKTVAFQPEALFSMKGDEYRYANDQRAIRLNLNYAELPLGMHLNLFSVVNLHGGAYVGYLINPKFKRVGGDGQVLGETDLNADNFNRLDYGWFLGAGLDLGNLGFHFRFNHGLQEIYKSNVQNVFGKVKNVNGTLSLSIGF